MNLIQTLEQEAIAELATKKNIPEVRAGDTLRVGVKVIEGDRTRVQNYEGVCIARSNKGMGSNFTVRKISFGEGVERVFPLYSPTLKASKLSAAALFVVRSFTICAAAPVKRRVSPNARLLPNRMPQADPVWLFETKIPKGPGSAKGTPAFFMPAPVKAGVPIASSNVRKS